MRLPNRKPVVGIPASVRYLEAGMAFHGTGQQYHDVVTSHIGGLVFTIPSLEHTQNAVGLLDHVDGLLLTGSFSNVHPSAYAGVQRTDDGFFDELRDRNSLVLIREAINRGIPLLGICRGMQELNVALGGTLHQALSEVDGLLEHRSDPSLPLHEQFLAAHDISFLPDSSLRQLVGTPRVAVNSSHMQGIDRLGEGIKVDAVADDGTAEIITVPDAPALTIGVQFHPEWYTEQTPVYAAVVQLFRSAVHRYADARAVAATSFGGLSTASGST